MAQIHLVLDDEQKNGWEDHIEEHPRYDSVSQLIRLAVQDKIHEDDTGDTDTATEEIQQVRNELLNELEELDRGIRAIDSTIVTEDELDNKFRLVQNKINEQTENEVHTHESNIEQRIEELFEYHIE